MREGRRKQQQGVFLLLWAECCWDPLKKPVKYASNCALQARRLGSLSIHCLPQVKGCPKGLRCAWTPVGWATAASEKPRGREGGSTVWARGVGADSVHSTFQHRHSRSQRWAVGMWPRQPTASTTASTRNVKELVSNGLTGPVR